MKYSIYWLPGSGKCLLFLWEFTVNNCWSLLQSTPLSARGPDLVACCKIHAQYNIFNESTLVVCPPEKNIIATHTDAVYCYDIQCNCKITQHAGFDCVQDHEKPYDKMSLSSVNLLGVQDMSYEPKLSLIHRCVLILDVWCDW